MAANPAIQVVTGAMGTLIPKLLQLLKEEYDLQKGVKKDVKFLTEELPSMHAALRKVANVPRDQLDSQVKLWADEVRELSYVMEDVVDSFLASVEGSEPAPNSHKFKELLKKMGNLLPKGKTRRKIAKKIKGIRIQVKEVADRRDRYMVNDAVANQAAAPTSVDPRLFAVFKDQKELVGIDVARDEITKRLADGEGGVPNKQLKILSIFGFGGLGKTTLAKVVHGGLGGEFERRAFVSVGQKPDLKKVLRDIFRKLVSEEEYSKSNALELDVTELIEKVRELLKNKRYFIVIDDIWDIQEWERIRSALEDSSCGSRIITTTRIFKVAKASGQVYHLKPLSHLNSEKLFYARVDCGKNNAFDLPTELPKRILQKCGGVPLAILTIASLLEGKPRESWSKVYDSIGFGNGDNCQVDNTRKILLYSYYDLPYYLRACLLHMSIYPEDYTVMKGTLIWKWVAEGFIKEEPGIGQFELGESYFIELVNRSLIQPVETKDLGLVIGCRVHDLVLDMICLLSKEQIFVTVLDTDDQNVSSQCTVRRLAVQKRVVEEGDSLAKMCKQQVRSFNATTCHIVVMPSLSSFEALRVLAMEGCTSPRSYSCSFHLDHLGSLVQLRYLGLQNMHISDLPEEIGKLKFLQTLILKNSNLDELPQSIGLLKQLKCLDISGDDFIDRLHLLGNLTSLEELTLFYANGGYGESQFVDELGKLTELRKLYMAIPQDTYFDQSMVVDLVKSLGKLQKIQVLHLCACDGGLKVKDEDWEGYAPPRQLHELRVMMQMDTLLAWIKPSLLPNLTSLWMRITRVKDEEMKIFGSFTELLTLILDWCEVLLPDVTGGFPKLRYFRTNAPMRFLPGAMPRLECIEFNFLRVEAPNDDGFLLEFASLGNLPSLQKVGACIDTDAAEEDMDKVVDALERATNNHSNRPNLEITYDFAHYDDWL